MDNTIKLPLDGSMSLEKMKDAIFIAVIAECKGNRTNTAKMLGISLRCVRYYVSRLEYDGHVIPKPKGYGL